MPDFLSYPDSGGVVTHTSESDIEISELSFNAVGDVALHVESCHNIYIHDLDFVDCVGGIYVPSCTGQIRIENIRARNIGDGTQGAGHSNVVQLNNTTDDGTGGIRGVVAYGGDTEDMISVFASSGLDVAHPLVIEGCHFESPLPPDAQAWASGSGSGIVVGDTSGSFIVVQDCTFLNCGQIGLGNSRGDHVIFRRNVLYGAQRTGGNVGIVMPFSGSAYTGNNEVSDNRVWWKNQAGGYNPYYDGGTSGTITGLSPQTNTFNDATIDPADLAIDPDTMIFAGGPPPATPGPTSLFPSRARIDGGQSVQIRGTGLDAATAVHVGDVTLDGADWTIDSSTQITFTAPPMAAGTYEVTVDLP